MLRSNCLALLLGCAFLLCALSGHAHDASSPGARPTKARIEPVRRADRTAKQNQLLSRSSINVFATLARHEELYESWQPLFNHILYDNSLTARDRELLILRIGWLCQAEYEWSQHAPMGRRAGLSEANIRQIMAGPAAAGVSEHDKLLMTACDELHADACITDATWQALAKSYSEKQLMDIVFTVGQYNLVSMALNSFGVQIDSGRSGFPDPNRTVPAGRGGRGATAKAGKSKGGGKAGGGKGGGKGPGKAGAKSGARSGGGN